MEHRIVGSWLQLTVAIGLIAYATFTRADGTDSFDPGPDSATMESRGAPHAQPPAWFAFPMAFYMPETRLGLGGTGGVHFAMEPALQTSDVQLMAVATARQQAILDLRTQLFVSESLAVGGALRLAVYPDYFYGIGNDTPRSAQETFTSRSIEVQLSSEWFLVPRLLRTGPRAWFRRESLAQLQLAPGGEPASVGIAGVDGYASAAVGWSITWDSRDSRFSPRCGSYVEAWYLLAPGTSADGLRFGRGAIDARRFLPLGRSLVFGIAGHLEMAHGSVPFTLLPRLGGDKGLRGYYEGRWRDRLLYAGQAELRFPIGGRLGGAVFAGLSDVASRPSDFGIRTIRPAAGAGARFRITDDGLNVRLDAGMGQEGSNIYFNIGEAF